MAEILDGKETAASLEAVLKDRLAKLREKQVEPKLAIILAGSSKPSAMYASFMQKVAKGYGIESEIFRESEDITEEELGGLITDLSHDREITGILMMMPLPKGISEEKMVALIDPDKDVDGLTDTNSGRLFAGKEGLFGCTPRAVMAILDHYHINPDGKKAVVIGRSNVIGKPVSLMLLKKNATVTICHSHTKDVADITKDADILVAAVGHAGYVTADMVKEGAIVIDVGINRVNGKTVGDVAFDEVSEKAGAITPVPGGVGSVTTTMVIENIIAAGEKQLANRG
ncbi:bifunctional 5,10-methylenetetrahydrofolate dehydrogenase/5,10-methenyltetrahydrofolate cyclohydrolase [uncultured Dialister sp.]|jgi:methylenetetrahydrofolate dehydrogenase (NADP+)/methenyltetrahydrofolate cyclohydrolase|uniref:bifunctional 5,10-methylenetetrahydrofolate dehydrogenase/5,10-methenyltetrahydrofolate cyclohydrolase n=1 Tax=uncultured Dialister sp. TaxID=278064 RepID=UPI0025EEF1FB|nr:bifunctional 5,10-methylenetetrahydrofolate dehydrogenase/5,10-methenyltetrahydrofolate cyclohydrolase [uncultured Dialister sp.]